MLDFQDVANYCRLTDLAYHGPSFTWSNKQEGSLICKKLDRVLINDAWLNSYPASYSVFDSGGCSDHLRGRVMLNAESHRLRNSSFKFVNILTSQPSFLPTVDNHWRSTTPLFISTSAIHRFTKKLKDLKSPLRSLRRESIGDLTKRTKDAFKLLCDKQAETLLNPTQDAAEEESQAYSEWMKISDLEEGFLKQRSKLHWLRVGDRNNRYYYQSLQVRRMRNSIREIHTCEGQILKGEDEIKAEAIRYFSGLLNHRPQSYRGCSVAEIQDLVQFRCSSLDQEALTKAVTSEEIRNTLFNMPLNKSPGPDGYTAEFFKSAWPIIGHDLVTAIQSFFANGFLPKGINSTILALIPKKESATGMKDYRPISCCNVLYKIITKVIGNRLKSILPQVISNNQSAFIHGRLLMENILLASELVKDYHKDHISPRCAMKIDIAKAFDSVQWDFLITTLEALLFPQKFIDWIRICITSPSFSIQINGELVGYFGSSRGLRQGCPLSPYLFVICMNVLSHLIDKAASAHRFDYHPKCKNIKLTHLCFADDLLVFVDGKKRSMEAALNVFHRFEELSGLQVSLEKSTIYTAGVDQDSIEAIKSTYNISSGDLPIRYLGLPLMSKRMSKQDYLPLIQRIKTQLQSWTGRFLSYAGRLQLINSVIYSLINFWISAFKLPKKCIQEINSLCSAFLWSGPELKTTKSKMSWSDICKPKQEGGLGVKNIQESNKVSCLKIIWLLLSSKSPWADWVSTYYLRRDSFWSAEKSASRGSWILRKILKLRTAAQEFHRIQLGNGNSTSFWHDAWSSLGRFFKLTGPRGAIDLGIPLQKSVADAKLLHRPRSLRSDVLHNIMISAQSAFTNLRHDVPDKHQWKVKAGVYNNKFSTKHTYQQIREQTSIKCWWRGIWFKHSTPKYSFIAWLAINNRLATGEFLQQWSPGAQVQCNFCGCILESRYHLFFICNYSGSIWRAIFGKLIPNGFCQDWDSLVDLISTGVNSETTTFLIRYAFQSTIYHVWRERNSRRHGKLPSPQSLLIKLIDKNVRNRISSLSATQSRISQEGLREWFDSRSD